MKNKSLKTVLLCVVTSALLAGCSNPLQKGNDEAAQANTSMETEQQVIHLQGVSAGTILDNPTLITYASSLTGESVASVACDTDFETNLMEVTLEEGIHTITLNYTTADGSTGSTELTYSADPATEGFEDDEFSEDGEATDDNALEPVAEENIPIENRITLTSINCDEVASYEEYSNNEDIDKSNLVRVLDVQAQLDFVGAEETLIDYTEISNAYEINEYGEAIYNYDDENYVATIDLSYYKMDNELVFKVSSINSDNELDYIYVPTEEALADEEVMNEEINNVSDVIGDYYEYNWTYDAKVIETEESDTGSISTGEGTDVADAEVLNEKVEKGYKAQHPRLWDWPESDIKFSRWDNRITDSTSFSSTITLADGTIIPQAQQNQEGYSYNFSNGSTVGNTSSTSTNSNTDEEQVEDTEHFYIEPGFEKFEIISYPAEGIKIDAENSTSKRVVLTYNGSNYYVMKISSDDWLKYENTDYYGNNYTSTEIVTSEALMIGEGLNKAQVITRNIQFSDSTGASEERSYMYGINCNTEYLVIVGEELPTRGNTTLRTIAMNCIIPMAANE